MSSRAPQQSSYHNRSPRDSRDTRGGDYQRDPRDPREGAERARSRSPTRSRNDDSYRRDYNDRDRSDRRDRDYDSSSRRLGGGYERVRGSERDRGGERDWEQEREREYQRERANPNNDPNYRPRNDDRSGGGRAGFQGSSARGGRGRFVAGRGGGSQYGGGRGGYGGGGNSNAGWDGRERDYQSMDRRAIEEGRRRREEERAMGSARTEDGRVIDPRDMERGQGPYGKAEFFEGDEQEGEVEDEQDEAEAQMAAMMGFGGFNTTKKKNVQQNVEGGANVHKERTWRQYMNRRGGFNRPLDKVKD
ncbi:hypothetical protein B9479_001886 [Cryptococcus floricola]|uniref:U4/U6.U5 small nuclear ribonucleoprotein 27kDa protein domain-containing protein n=1 Tax=Cryptococcus floricola TaxID=2591691 RepID=A0A5D3B0S7_9TREE|nr:hypothetical protein B9479_001886 [Cryptococcus floricola]